MLKFITLLFLTVITNFALAAQKDAEAVTDRILKLHFDYNIILPPGYENSQSDVRISYNDAGDSSLWTGVFLAAESFRYAVTKSPHALDNVKRALDGQQSLADITGDDGLARCLYAVDSPLAEPTNKIEIRHGIYKGKYQGRDYYWTGNQRRDQYVGVFFGLAVAYDFVDDQKVKNQAAELITRHLNRLIKDGWHIIDPKGKIVETFIWRYEQILSFLQVGRHVNPKAFEQLYFDKRKLTAKDTSFAISIDAQDEHKAYYKFNLDYMVLYNLVRLEENDSVFKKNYESAYSMLRQVTFKHGNPHFNMIDRALYAADKRRDGETATLLDEWLKRDHRAPDTDYRGKFQSCKSPERACNPLPVILRAYDHFLWQKSPFTLVGGESRLTESPGIDYILPYWMARYFGVVKK